MHNLAIPCSAAVKESFKRQVATRAAQRGHWMSVAAALREAVTSAGYSLSEQASEPPVPATEQVKQVKQESK